MDQAERLRDLVNAGKPRARVVAVTSGKGGVGKTSVAVNLALALAAQGKRVILVDVDIGLANADVLLGVQPRVHLGHVLSGEVGPLEALTLTPGGLALLPGCAGMRHLSDLEPGEREFLIRSFEVLEKHADFIFFDTGAGISGNVVQFSAAADEIIVVTVPEPTAITDGYAAVKAISREKGCGRIRLVVNMAAGKGEGARVAQRIRLVARRFLGIEVGYLGHVVLGDQARLAVRRRRPLLLDAPQSPVAACIRKLAQTMVGEKSRGATHGFFKRFASAMSGIMS